MENIKDGLWFDFCIDETNGVIGLKIRPHDQQIAVELIKKYAVTQKRKKYKIKNFNDSRMIDEYLDYLLEDFRNIMDTEKNNQPLTNNLENKKALIKSFNLYNFTCEGQDIQTFILKKASEQAGFSDTINEISAKNEQILIREMNKRRKKDGR